MNNLFVPYKIALALKEIGFDEPCIGSYEDNKLSPPPVLHVTYSNQPIDISMWKEEYIEAYKKRPKMFEGEEPKNSKISQWMIAAPLYDQVIDWFIEKHRILLVPDFGIGWICLIEPHGGQLGAKPVEGFKTRKEALNAGILKAIELIKQKDETTSNTNR